LHGSTGTRK